jgi:NAD+ kinase
MLVALYNRTFETDDIPTLQKIIHQLSTYTVRFVFFEDFYTSIKEYISIAPERIDLFSSTKKLPSNTDMLISFGGDGTILDTILFVGNSNIPVVGINLGRLGFLAAISEDDAPTTIHALMHGAYNIEKRSLLHLDANCELFGTTPFGLNEFTIHRKDSSSMIKIHTYLNGEFLNTYWADGLIVATPTGSTGYSLSCGGPVVFPQASNFIITPVAPHNLNLRSIIVPDDVIISFEVEGRADTFLCTLDSRSETITSSAQIAIRKENFSFSFIRPHDHNFLKTIRQKLYWGVDRRN